MIWKNIDGVYMNALYYILTYFYRKINSFFQKYGNIVSKKPHPAVSTVFCAEGAIMHYAMIYIMTPNIFIYVC